MSLLKELGLNAYEQEIYKALLENGMSSGKKIAECSRVPPTAVYPNLKTLQEKQLIQKFEGDPALFEALPPEFAIKTLIERKKNKLTELQETAIKEAQHLLNKPEEKTEKSSVIITHGRGTSTAVYFESMNHVKKTFYVLGWRLIKAGDKYKFIHKFKELVHKGIDVRIILTGPLNKEWNLVEAYLKAGVHIKYLPLDNFSIFVVDKKECKISLKNRELTTRFNLQFLDDSLAKAMHYYFLSMWKKAKHIRDVKPQ